MGGSERQWWLLQFRRLLRANSIEAVAPSSRFKDQAILDGSSGSGSLSTVRLENHGEKGSGVLEDLGISCPVGNNNRANVNGEGSRSKSPRWVDLADQEELQSDVEPEVDNDSQKEHHSAVDAELDDHTKDGQKETLNGLARKGYKGYDKLCIIIGDTTAIGDNIHPSTKSPTISDDDKEEDEEKEEEEVESSRAKKKSKVGGKWVQLRQQVKLAMVEAFTSMGESNRKKMEWRERKMSFTYGHSHVSGAIGPSGGSNEIVNCITALSALEGIDSTQFSKATHVLHDDMVWRTMFLAMLDERKKEWVLCRP
ncbi:uncharacterized protein A4U43_C06F19760 [Asparagus officinalis]|uniref:Uncharacterized protein n=1 Tax=Asparagus officinalis TaxID=4686 RepID=A0A5P1ERP2_ASPOF|nr:uncharacterized protein A4U43_C06F19760 [Asparagus officinalis]